MKMNKKIIIIAIVIGILIILAGYFLMSRQSGKETFQEQKTPSLETEDKMAEDTPFDTNDNLDQAIEDLKFIE